MTTTLPALPKRPKPVVLAILDGWGLREGGSDNAIANARTPHWDALWSEFPKGLLDASAEAVGLPEGQMGNSEVGHMNIGAGRVILQDLPRIDKAIAEGQVPAIPAFKSFLTTVIDAGGTIHLAGLLSPGGVHAHQGHMAAIARLFAERGMKVNIHAFLDGRDTPPRSAVEYLMQFEADIAGFSQNIRIATVSGRFFAMDRDKRWDRVEKAYNAMVRGVGRAANTALDAVQQAYDAGQSDEFVEPTVIGDYAGTNDGDALFMANFRADRAREILHALCDPEFDGFTREKTTKFSARLGMVEYSSALNALVNCLFPAEQIRNTLGETLSRNGLSQLRIAETEKYAHVTFFLNAGEETTFPGEDRILVPSPKVATYDLQPEMSAFEVLENLERVIAAEHYDVIVVNFANPDMVGHTGNMAACVKAVETVDACLGRLQQAVFDKEGVLLITADHGNIEQLEDHSTHQAHTAHTLSLVPFVVASKEWQGVEAALPTGKLCDVAPTVLHLLQLPVPEDMTGTSRIAMKGAAHG